MTLTKWTYRMTACMLAFTLLSLNSMVALAAPAKLAGEIIVSDRGANVTVNGEVAKTGRTIFSGSTIDTPKDSSAIVSIGSLGRLELAPSTSITLSFDDNGIVGTLASGRVTVLSTSRDVAINGATYGAGATAETATTQTDDTQTANTNTSSNKWWVWAAIFGGGIAGIVLASRTDNTRISLGGGTNVVSPLR